MKKLIARCNRLVPLKYGRISGSNRWIRRQIRIDEPPPCGARWHHPYFRPWETHNLLGRFASA